MRRFVSVALRSSFTLSHRPAFTSTPFRAFATSSGASKSPAPSNTKDSDRRTGDYGPADGGKVALDQEGQSNSKASGVSSDTSSASKKSSSSTSSPPSRKFSTSTSSSSSSHVSPSDSAPKGPSQKSQGDKARSKQDPTIDSTTETSKDAQHRKASGKTSTYGTSASDVHRRQEEYTKRDQGTGAEANVAADRAAHDPLPDHLKHSSKMKKGV